MINGQLGFNVTPAKSVHINSSTSQDGIRIDVTTFPEISWYTSTILRGFMSVVTSANGYVTGTLANSFLFRNEAGVHHFSSSSDLAVTIRNSRLGIGTNDPQYPLHVKGIPIQAVIETAAVAGQEAQLGFRAARIGTGTIVDVANFAAAANAGSDTATFKLQMIDADGVGFDDGFGFIASAAGNNFTHVGIGRTPTNTAGDGQLQVSAGVASEVPLAVFGVTSQSVSLQEWRDVSLNILSRINKDGYFMTRKTSAPADGDLANSELALWFDATPGSAKLMIKAKNSSGTVVTGSVALS
jgi:hypothetical protein